MSENTDEKLDENTNVLEKNMKENKPNDIENREQQTVSNSNTETAQIKESLRVQKSEWIKAQIQKQREAEDALLEQMLQEQKVLDRLNSSIDDNMERTKESRKFNQEFQENINSQIYAMNGITEDKLKGIREYKNAYYQGCAFSLFLLSVVLIVICGVLHGFQSEICLFMIAYTGLEGALLAQEKKRNKLFDVACKLLYLLLFPVMMVIFVCFELGYPEYDLFLPYCAIFAIAVLIIGTAGYFLYDPYKQDKKRVKSAKDYINDVEKIARKEVKKNQKLRAKEEKKTQKQLEKENIRNVRQLEKDESDQQKQIAREERKVARKEFVERKREALISLFNKKSEDNTVENFEEAVEETPVEVEEVSEEQSKNESDE